MAEKTSTLILKVNLECHLCYKKIRKVLCKLQDRENIRVIAYDEKNNTITLTGPFDPHWLSKKLQCKACKVIKDIQIIDNAPKEKPKEKEKEEKPKEKEKEEKPKSVEPAKPVPKPDPPKTNPTPLKPEPEPPKPKTDPPKPDPVVPAPELVFSPDPPAWPAGPVCSCRPYYVGYYWGPNSCNCGSAYGLMGPPYPYPYPCPDMYNKSCHFFCEEERSCRIM